MTETIQLDETPLEITKCKALQDKAMGETYPILLFQETRMPPENPSARIAAQSQLVGSLLQKRRIRSSFAFVLTKKTTKGLNL